MKRATAHRVQEDRALLLCEPRRLPAAATFARVMSMSNPSASGGLRLANDLNGASVDGAVVHA